MHIIRLTIASLVTLCCLSITATAQTADKEVITERGLITSVEEAGNPFFNVTIEFPERNFSEHFTINLEEVKTVDAGVLPTWVGKHVKFDYTSEIVNALIDLRYKGKSVFPKDNKRPPISGAKSITGILSNAEYETQGDIPDELYIQTEEEITLKFPFFIDKEIVKLNGKKVVGDYQERTQNTIVAIKLIK